MKRLFCKELSRDDCLREAVTSYLECDERIHPIADKEFDDLYEIVLNKTRSKLNAGERVKICGVEFSYEDNMNYSDDLLENILK